MKQGEIWLINLDPTIGAEIKKTRPAIIVNTDDLRKLPLNIIVPVTDWKDKYSVAPWMIKLTPNIENGLSKNSAADCFQVRSVSQTRFLKQIGNLQVDELKQIMIGLSSVLEIR